MTEMELLRERMTRMACNAVDQAEAVKKLSKIIEKMHDDQHKTNLSFTKMGEDTVNILKQLDEKTSHLDGHISVLQGRTVGIIGRMDKHEENHG